MIESVAGSCLTPLLPRYTHDFGLSLTQAGMFAAAYGAGMLLGGVSAGRFADRFGLRGSLVGVSVLMAVALAWFGLTGGFIGLVASRVVQGFAGAVIWTMGLAWLVAASPEERRGRHVGLVSSATLIGSVLGPTIGALAVGVSAPAAFGAVAALSAGTAVFAALLPPSPRAPAQSILGALRSGAREPAYRLAAALCLSLVLLLGTFGVLTPLKLSALGASTAGIAAVFVAAAVIEGAASAFWGDLSDRYGRVTPMLFGMVGMGAIAVLFGLADGLVLFCAAILALGPLQSAVIAPGMALTADAADRASMPQAQNFALVNLLWALGGMAGGVLGGTLADRFDVTAAYCIVGGLSVLIAVGVVRRGHLVFGRS